MVVVMVVLVLGFLVVVAVVGAVVMVVEVVVVAAVRGRGEVNALVALLLPHQSCLLLCRNRCSRTTSCPPSRAGFL